MALRYHMLLDALRRRQGSAYGLQMLMQVAVLTAHLDSRQRWFLSDASVAALADDLLAAFRHGTATHEWFLDAPAVESCAGILTEHDRQLRVTPRGKLFEAVEYLKRVERQLLCDMVDAHGTAEVAD